MPRQHPRQPEADAGADSLPEGAAATPEQMAVAAVPETYSGRIYLMFPSSLGQEEQESVWDVLEEVAGSGAIVDRRLVSREAGIQFTLELRNRVLSVEDLRKRLPGAGLEALEEDRLKVDWPRRA